MRTKSCGCGCGSCIGTLRLLSTSTHYTTAQIANRAAGLLVPSGQTQGLPRYDVPAPERSLHRRAHPPTDHQHLPRLGLPSTAGFEAVFNRANTATYRVLDGRQHYVTRVVMIAGPMVMNGSNGPIFYPADEIDRSEALWNGVPVTVGHVTDDREAEYQRIGVITNAQSEGGRLKAEAWLDVERTKQTHPEVLDAITSNQALAVSTGLLMTRRGHQGSHLGVAYNETAHDFQPHHLAVLLSEEGACSVTAGCMMSRLR